MTSQRNDPTETSATTSTTERAAQAKATLRKARAVAADLANDPTLCVHVYSEMFLPLHPLEDRAEVLTCFRWLMRDDAERLRFVSMLYGLALTNYNNGEYDT